MAKDINQIIKSGKLTGEEVGRLMIKDLTALYKEASNDRDILNGDKEASGLLTPTQRTAMVDGLSNSEDIRTYNDYRALHGYLTTEGMTFTIHQLDAEAIFWRLYHLLKSVKKVESENQYLRWQPKIMTQKQYDELKQKDFDYKMTFKTSMESLIFNALEYYISLYEAGKKTPLNKYFDKAKKEPLINPRIKANYWIKGEGGYYVLPDGRSSRDMDKEEWQEEVLKTHRKKGTDEIPTLDELTWIEYLTAPEDATKWNILEYGGGFYYSQETDSQETLLEFKNDYPEIYKDIIDNLSSMKGLSFLKATPETEYFNDDLIAWKDLYDNKILNYTAIVDDIIDSHLFSGIAIMQEPVMDSSIDEQGYYKAPTRGIDIPNAFTANKFLEEYSTLFTKTISEFTLAIKECFAIKEAFNLYSIYVDIPEINILLGNVGLINQVITLNDTMKELPTCIERYGNIEGERPAEELIKELKDLLKPIDTTTLKPTKEAIKKANEIVDLKLLKDKNQDRLYKILKGVN